MASTMFVDEEKKAAIRGWYDTFRAKAPVACEDREVDTAFGRTHVLITGRVDAPPLVVAHGALASSAHILPELTGLLEARRLYILDVVGQSVMSEDRRIEVQGDDYGRWVGEVTTALGLAEFDLFGVSWGGFVATRAAVVLGSRVKRLVLVVPAGFVAGPIWLGLREVAWPMFMYRAFPSPKRLERLVTAFFSSPEPDWAPYFGEALLSYRMDMRVPPQLTPEQARRITCPVLVFAAENDASFPGAALIARARELLPQAEVELLEGVKHSPPMTAEFREKLARRVLRFLGEG
jgi:2-hydroxy-6-oxonona-2,4-dienedioate hydrolase